jgi:hypothetical protein
MSVKIAPEAEIWLKSLVSHGAVVVTAQGRFDLSPQIRLLVDAMHVVLSGGTVSVTTKGGDVAVKGSLDKELVAAIDHTVATGSDVYYP